MFEMKRRNDKSLLLGGGRLGATPFLWKRIFI